MAQSAISPQNSTRPHDKLLIMKTAELNDRDYVTVMLYMYETINFSIGDFSQTFTLLLSAYLFYVFDCC